MLTSTIPESKLSIYSYDRKESRLRSKLKESRLSTSEAARSKNSIPRLGILFTLEDSIRRDFNSVTSFEGEKQVVGRELHPLRREDRPEMPLTSDIFHDFPPAAWSIKYLIIKHDTTRLPRRCCVYECTRIEDSASVGCLSRLRVGLKSILHPRLPPCSGCWPAESLRGLATP